MMRTLLIGWHNGERTAGRHQESGQLHAAEANGEPDCMLRLGEGQEGVPAVAIFCRIERQIQAFM